jgi:hypothetical protein
MDRDNEVESAEALLVMDPDTERFFKAETGIQDSEELRKHIIQTQQEACKASHYLLDNGVVVVLNDAFHAQVYPYPCIRGFRFTKLKIARMPAYPRVFQLLKNRPDAIFLDIGCCRANSFLSSRLCWNLIDVHAVGTDLRKIVYDGWPISQTLATDLEAGMRLAYYPVKSRRITSCSATGYWDVGHKLFRTSPETYPAKFLAGGAFEDAHLCPTAPIPPGLPPPVASVNTLTELLGHVSVVYSSSLFHLFNEEKQLELAKRFAALLDPRPGSIIFGSHIGMPVKGQRNGVFPKMFCHSSESWTKMWEEDIFERGQVKVNTVLVELNNAAERLGLGRGAPGEGGATVYGLAWSVERL